MHKQPIDICTTQAILQDLHDNVGHMPDDEPTNYAFVLRACLRSTSMSNE